MYRLPVRISASTSRPSRHREQGSYVLGFDTSHWRTEQSTLIAGMCNGVQINRPFSKIIQCLQLDDLDISVIGPPFETNAVFPAKTNTEFVQVLSRSHVKMVVWERGAGRTLACGTGACALVVAGVLEGHIDRTCRCAGVALLPYLKFSPVQETVVYFDDRYHLCLSHRRLS